MKRLVEDGSDFNKMESDESNREDGLDIEMDNDDSPQVKILKTEVYYLKRLITELYEKISMQNTVINLFQKEDKQRPINTVPTCDSDKEKTFTRPMKNKPGIIIESRNNIHNEIIKDLQDNIKLDDLAINITKMKTTNNGIIIQCEKEEEGSTLKTSIENTLGEKFKPDLLKTYGIGPESL